MEDSILLTVKKLAGLEPEYDPFDDDIILFINSTLSTLNQLGIGPAPMIVVTDTSVEWNDLQLPTNILSMVKTYIGLKVRLTFDPPATSFAIEAMNNQIQEHESRLLTFMETGPAA